MLDKWVFHRGELRHIKEKQNLNNYRRFIRQGYIYDGCTKVRNIITSNFDTDSIFRIVLSIRKVYLTLFIFTDNII